jgi:hypothetical protein
LELIVKEGYEIMQAVMPWNGKTIKAKKNHSCKVVSIFGRTTAIAAWCRNGVLVFQWRRNIILESKVILFSWFSQNQVVEACTVLFCKVQSSPKACNKFHIQNLQDMGSNPITSTKQIPPRFSLQDQRTRVGRLWQSGSQCFSYFTL